MNLTEQSRGRSRVMDSRWTRGLFTFLMVCGPARIVMEADDGGARKWSSEV
jgi:hypothetical protein